MDNGGAISDGTSSASGSSSTERCGTVRRSMRPAKQRPATQRPALTSKKRKTTYYVRKDEIQSLQEQVQCLQEKLSQYEHKAPAVASGPTVGMLVNAALASAVQQTTLSLAGTQSLLSAQTLAMLRSTGVVPLKDKIHLPKDLAQRDAVMRTLHDSKLRSALSFMTERTRFLDLSVAHKQSEQFTLPDGQVGTMSLDVTQFTGGHSLRQVYDALMFFVRNQEITISEKLGIVTVRESDEFEEVCERDASIQEGGFCEERFLSTVPGGLEVESNIVMFATCVDATDDRPAFAVAAMDFVDQDDLYPYRPHTCARRELTGALTLHEIPSLTGDCPTIAMARWSYATLAPPPFPFAEEIAAAALDNMLNWCAVIPKIMQEQLSGTPPSPTPNACGISRAATMK